MAVIDHSAFRIFDVHLPEKLLESLQGINGFDRAAFENVHASGEQVTSIRFNPSKPPNSRDHVLNSETRNMGGTIYKRIPWTEHGFYLAQRPSFTFDPLFHAGCYYVQEASSMFLEQALKQTVDLSQPIKVLDAAAAPGGKSTHIQSLISTSSLLVSNEVIRNRNNILQDNLIKWGCHNIIVTNNDPAQFSRLEGYFDVIVVDAPCSGSGLFRRDEDAINEWSENNVRLCSQRQQRILAGVWPSLKRHGILIYSTCSYSREEDEDIVRWITDELRGTVCELNIAADWNIVESSGGYRFWPDKVKGEGFFIACVRKEGEENENVTRGKSKLELLNAKDAGLIKNWLNRSDQLLVKMANTVYALSSSFLTEINKLSNNLHVTYFATRVGELVRDKLIPDHALAMSGLLPGNIERIEVGYDRAIRYLQKKDLDNVSTDKGWKLITYLGRPLGWINVLEGRINNYYPKELRILKDI